MSSPPALTENSNARRSSSKKTNERSKGLVIAGFVLLTLALLLFFYVRFYRPEQTQFVYEGRIERIPPTGPAEPASDRKSSPTQKNDARESHSNGGSRKHHVNRSSYLELGQTRSPSRTRIACQTTDGSSIADARAHTEIPISMPENSPTPTVSPTTPAISPTPQPAKKKNVLKRFFDWLAGLFKGKTKTNSPPLAVNLVADRTMTACDADSLRVRLNATVRSAGGVPLHYIWIVNGGKVVGEGPSITWDLDGTMPGQYVARVEVNDERSGLNSRAAAEVLRVPCTRSAAGCPNISISCPESAGGDTTTPITFTATIGGGSPGASVTYDWAVSDGRIIGGQNTPSIAVDAAGLSGKSLTAYVNVGGFALPCPASCTTVISVKAAIQTPLFGNVRDAGGSAISGAVVVAVDGQGRSFSAMTDSNGYFEIQHLAPGSYRLEISAPGFGKQVRNVNVSALQSSLDLILGAGPNPTPTAENTPPPLGTPAPTPTATATPSPEVTTSPTPAKKMKEQDQIKVDYPERFLKDTEGEITFELDRVLREVISSETNINGSVEVIDKPGPIPGATPEVPLYQSFGENYDAYAAVRLVPKGLSVTSSPANLEQPLKEKLVKWAWRLKPEDNDALEASFTFAVDIIWRAKVPGSLPDVVRPNVWSNKPLRVKIGPPPSVKAAKYGSPVLAAGGLAALGLGGRRRRRLLAEVEEDTEDDVSTTVFAPTEAAPGNSFLVQVFAHLPEQAEALDEIAREADEDARRRISAQLQKTIKRGTVLTFNLTMAGLEIDAPAQSCVWNGTPALVQFGVTVPKDSEPRDILGLVIVCENTVPIGHLRFKFRIATAASVKVIDPVRVGNASRYRQAFISYASPDRNEVLKRVQMLNSLKLKFFQDLLTLEPGDEWEKAIYQYIDESDVFFLFWSKAASESAWVKKEIQYAMRRKDNREEAAPEIVPVIIEGPPPASPPSQLQFLHFNDKFLYFITASRGEG